MPLRSGELEGLEEDYGVKLCQTVTALLSDVCTPRDSEFDRELHHGD